MAIKTTYAILNEPEEVSSFMHLLSNFAGTGKIVQVDIFMSLEGTSSIACAELILMSLIQSLTLCSLIL